MNIGGIGFSAVKVPFFSYEDRWSYDLENLGRWDPIRFCPTKSLSQGVTILALPVPDEKHSPSFRLGTVVFTPTWAAGMATNILMVFMDQTPDDPAHLISYHLRLSNKDPSHHLALMQWNDKPALRIPWNFHSLSNSGHMFELTKSLWCFSAVSSSASPPSLTTFPDDAKPIDFLNPDGTQPMNELELRPNILPEFDPVEIMRTSVEPWSGSIVALANEKLWVIHFDHKKLVA
jgi:hypothetical protein